MTHEGASSSPVRTEDTRTDAVDLGRMPRLTVQGFYKLYKKS